MSPPVPTTDFPADAWQAVLAAVERYGLPRIGAWRPNTGEEMGVAAIGLTAPGDSSRGLRAGLYVCWSGNALTVIDSETAEELGTFTDLPALTQAILAALAVLDAKGRFARRSSDTSSLRIVR